MRWHLVALTALLLVAAVQAAHTQTPSPTCEVACQVNPFTAPSTCDCDALGGEQSQKPDPPEPVQAGPSCEVACSVNPFTAPSGCNCNATITTGGGGPAPGGGGGGEPTVDDLIDEMIATYEAEMAQVQNYLLIEKSKASPLPDIRYYERRSSSPGNTGSGGSEEPFEWIPNQELGRRELAANPSHGSGNSRTEIPPEVANDPTLFVNALGDALEILGNFAGAGDLGKAAGLAADAEAAKIRADAQESRDGIEGADTLAGLITDHSLHRNIFWPGGRVARHGFYRRESDDYLLPEEGSVEEDLAKCYALLNAGCGSLPVGYIPCAVRFPNKKEFLDEYVDMESLENIPPGSVIESGQLWYCDTSEPIVAQSSRPRPVRLSLTYLDADLTRVTIQEENKDFVRRGPVLIPRRIQKRILRGAQFFIDEKERELRGINEGPPTQADLAAIVGETMDWDAFYNQASP